MKFKQTKLYAVVGAALGTLAYVALRPVHDHYMRNYVLQDTPGEIKALETTVLGKFKEIQDNIKATQDATMKAVDDVKREGTLYAKTADVMRELGEKGAALKTEFATELKKLSDKFLEIEQKAATSHAQATDAIKSAGQLFADSESYKRMMSTQGKNPKSCDPVEVSRSAIEMGHRKTVIANPNPLTNDQPLVQAQRLPGIITPANRRLYIRDLLPQIPTGSNVIEFCRELVFTNAAAPQGSGASPDATEGQPKAEGGITFELANAVVITIAHWIPASRQVLSDATQLAAYIDARLMYGLKLEEEDELLNSNGTAGELNGLRNQATAFAYGSTNQSAIDTLLKAFLQVSLSNYEASGVVMHPTDWVNIMLLKDTTGRYLFSDPQAAGTPRIWGKDVVPTASQTLGRFLTGAFDLGAAIYDREGATIRVSDQHSDFFTRNLVAILCEERIAFAMYRSTAFVEGAVSNAG